MFKGHSKAHNNSRPQYKDMMNALVKVAFLVTLVLNTCGFTFVTAIRDPNAKHSAQIIVVADENSVKDIPDNNVWECEHNIDCLQRCGEGSIPVCYHHQCGCM